MNTKRLIAAGSAALIALGIFRADAQDSSRGAASTGGTDLKELETEKDLPGSFTRYYGQRRNQFNDTERKIASIDLDADLNYDGTIDDDDPADGGAFEQTPPGLILGPGEVSKLIVRVRPFRVDYEGDAVVALELMGINRGDRTGNFASFEEEVRNTSRVKVWKDPQRTQLLLDSADPNRRYVEWTIEDKLFPANIPNIVPRTVYVEGISPSGIYPGDMRLLLLVTHRAPGETASEGGAVEQASPGERNPLFRRFRTSFDHLLVTVKPTPHPKEFINNNAEGVWLGRGASGSN